jgi:hypothetical protein
MSVILDDDEVSLLLDSVTMDMNEVQHNIDGLREQLSTQRQRMISLQEEYTEILRVQQEQTLELRTLKTLGRITLKKQFRYLMERFHNLQP